MKSRKIIRQKDYSKEFIKGVKNSQRKQSLYKGSYWVMEDKELLEYSKKYPYPIEKSRWKPLLRYPEYKISDNGYIIDKRGIIRIGYEGSFGYRRIEIQGTSYRIHRLVYETFVLGRLLKDDEYIDHISTITDQNDVSNLRMVTQSENMNNISTRIKSTKGEICQYDLFGNLLKVFKNSIEVEEAGFNRRNVLGCCTSEDSLTHGGFIWFYKNGDEKSLERKFKKISEIYWKACQYDDFGNLINTYTKKELKDSNLLELNAIRETCKNLGSTYQGYYWCFEEDQEKLLEIIRTNKKPRKGFWNIKENCVQEASKYTNRFQFMQNSGGGAYRASIRNGWLDEFFPK